MTVLLEEVTIVDLGDMESSNHFIDVTSSGVPYVSFVDSGDDLNIASRGGGSWSISEEYTGQCINPAMHVDSNDNPNVSYLNLISSLWRLYWYRGSTDQNIDFYSGSSNNRALGTDIWMEGTGDYPYGFIIYWDKTLRYISIRERKFDGSYVDHGTASMSVDLDAYGRKAAVSIDYSGRAFASYNGTNLDLYTYDVDGGTDRNITASPGDYSSIKYDGTYIKLLYVDSDDLVYGYCTRVGFPTSTWYPTVVESGVGYAAPLSMDLDSSGNPHIVYAKGGNLYFGYYDGSWHTTSVYSGTYTNVSLVSIAVDSSDKNHIAFVDSGVMYYLYGANGDFFGLPPFVPSGKPSTVMDLPPSNLISFGGGIAI